MTMQTSKDYNPRNTQDFLLDLKTLMFINNETCVLNFAL